MGYVIFFLLTLLAEILGTIGGFGSSMFFVGLAQFAYDFKTVLALTGLLHIFSNISKLILFRQSIQWKLVLWLGVSSTLLAIVGAFLTRWIEFTYAKLLLGLFLTFFSLWMWWRPSDRISPTLRNSVVGGALAGFLAGFIGTGGAVRGMVLASFHLEKNLFVGTSAAIDFGVDLSRSIIYASSGFFDFSLIGYLPLMLVASFAGSYIGKRILAKISHETFRKIVLLLVLIIGLTLLGQELYLFISW
jgi:uncharacterized membrane protein YfcA